MVYFSSNRTSNYPTIFRRHLVLAIPKPDYFVRFFELLVPLSAAILFKPFKNWTNWSGFSNGYCHWKTGTQFSKFSNGIWFSDVDCI
jgi:hypothetical protein